jgi:hypothetical protein
MVRDGGKAPSLIEQDVFKEGNREDFVKIGEALVRLSGIIHGRECFLQRALVDLSRRTDLASLYKQRGRVKYTPLERGDM